MSTLGFLCDAIYRGSQIVEGAVSTSILTSLAEIILNELQSTKGYAQVCIDKLPRGEKCQLQIDEERLRVSSNKKDEGFESDSETSSASSTAGFEETLCGSPEIKVINDHVLRLEKLIRQDSGIHRCVSQTSEDGGSISPSSSSSSGAESEEDTPKKQQNKSQRESTANSQVKTQLSQVENGSGDFLMSDILFCHVMTQRTKIVIVVVKAIDTNLIAAHIFECLSSEAAKTLYRCYYTASNKYKLDRYRMSKRRCEGVVKADKKLKDNIKVSIKNVKKEVVTTAVVPSEKNHIVDRSNINVIEITTSTYTESEQSSMMQRVDENGVTHIEIDSTHCSLTPAVQESELSRSSLDSFQLLSALERLSLHSTNNPDSYLNFVGVTGSCPNSLIQTSREIITASGDRKSRQREPPLLLKKGDVPKETNKRDGRRQHRSRSEEGRKEKGRNAKNVEMSNTLESSNKNLSTSNRVDKPEVLITNDSTKEIELKNTERQSRQRSTSRPKEARNSRPRSSHNKRPAPPPPPRRHPNNPSLMLVPTKSGQETTRAYYPKESHIMRGSKIVRIDYPLYPPWNMNTDINNNNQQMLFYPNRGWYGPHEFHSSRRTDPVMAVEMRKRSRSKSPARRPTPNKYIDAVSAFSLTQKIKDLSDSVKLTWKTNGAPLGSPSCFPQRENFPKLTGRKEKKMNPPLTAAHFVMNNKKGISNDQTIRPVIKKGKRTDSDSRRVTFSAYATVQLMDS